MIDDEAPKPAPEKFVAAKYSSGKVVMMKNSRLIIPLIHFNQEFISFFFFCLKMTLCWLEILCAQSVHCWCLLWFVAGLKTSFVFSCAVCLNNTR